MRKPRCLILAPFDDLGRRVQWSLREALGKYEIEVEKFDDFLPGAKLAHAVQNAIRSCDFVIADITGQNPNVLYELGLVHALRKPAILIVSETSSAGIPATLEGSFYVVYDPLNLDDLAHLVLSRALPLAEEAKEKYA